MLNSVYLEPLIQDTKFYFANSILPALLILLCAVIIHRIVNMVTILHETRLNSAIGRADGHDRRATLRRRRGGVQVVGYAIKLGVWLACILWSLGALGIHTSSLVPVTAVLIAALGFGGRRLVTDYISGAVITSEQQLGRGDDVEVHITGIEGPMFGSVESITLRSIRIRTEDGGIGTFGFGDIVGIINRSPGDWSRVVMEIDVPTSSNLEECKRIIEDAARSIQRSHPESFFRNNPALVVGATRQLLDQTTLKVECRVIPGKQDWIRQIMLLRIQQKLQERDIVGKGREVPNHDKAT